MRPLLATLAVALILACGTVAPTAERTNIPMAPTSSPLTISPSAPSTAAPPSASPRTSESPRPTFPPLATLPPVETGDVAVHDSRIVRFREFRARSALLIVEVRNTGEGWAQLIPDETLWRAEDAEGIVLASGTFLDAFPAFVPPGGSAWMWVAVPTASSRGEADLAWDNAVEPARSELAVVATASRVGRSRLRVSVRVENTGSQTEQVRLAVVAFDPDGRVAAAGSELSGWELQPGQARKVDVVARGRVTGGSTIPFQVIAEPSSF